MGERAVAEADREFERALELIESENTLAALAHLEKALRMEDNPSWYSYLGYCIARERGQLRKGIELCRTAMETDKDNPLHNLYLGRILLISGEKGEALQVLREGLSKEDNAAIRRQLDQLGVRKLRVFPFLQRSHPLNKYLGLLFCRLGFGKH